jgi:hypothetical protein
MTDKQRVFWENFAAHTQAERLEFLSHLKDQEAKEDMVKAFCLELEECVRRLIAEVKEIT